VVKPLGRPKKRHFPSDTIHNSDESMKIGLFHGYNLGGSGSNEYTRYLAKALIAEGAEIHLICREPDAASLDFIDIAARYDGTGQAEILFDKSKTRNNTSAPLCYLHELPDASVQPVYVTDKQRDGVVKSFANLTDAELQEYHDVSSTALKAILTHHPLDMLHCNHVTYQPQIAEQVCKETNTPYIIYPHGSAIEYTVKPDERYFNKVRESIQLTDVDTALFTSCPENERQQSLDKLIAMNLGGGKSEALTRELEQKLDAGEIDAVTQYRNSYIQKLPDEDISAKLGKLDLNSPVLLFVGAFTAGKPEIYPCSSLWQARGSTSISVITRAGGKMLSSTSSITQTSYSNALTS